MIFLLFTLYYCFHLPTTLTTTTTTTDDGGLILSSRTISPLHLYDSSYDTEKNKIVIQSAVYQIIHPISSLSDGRVETLFPQMILISLDWVVKQRPKQQQHWQ